MEKYEVTILGDEREAVVCAHSAIEKYPEKNVLIIVTDFQCFLNKISSLFFLTIDIEGETDYQLLFNGNRIKVIIDEAVERKGHKLFLQSGRTIVFEKLILAQSCRFPALPIKGLDNEGIYFIKSNFDDLMKVKEKAVTSKNIVIYGGGYIGVKLADELVNKNKNVVLIEKSSWLLPETINMALGKEVTSLLINEGCRVILNRKIRRINGNDAITSVELSDSQKIDCDILLISCKNKPDVSFAQKLGLICDRDRGILVDEYCRTSERDIFAIGESAAHFEFFKGDLANAILSSIYEIESSIVGANLYSVIYNREKQLENLYSMHLES